MKNQDRWVRMRAGMKPACMAVILAVTIMSTACGNTAASTQNSQTQTIENESVQSDMTQDTAVADELADYIVEYSDRDADSDWSDEDAVEIAIAEDGITASGQGVTVDGTTITITAEGTYVLSGTASEVNLVVNAPESKIHIVLNGVSLTSAVNAPISVEDSKKVVITLAEGTDNTITDKRSEDADGTNTIEAFEAKTTETTETETTETSESDTTETSATEADDAESDAVNAAIYSKENLTFNGTGNLTVVSEHNNGITSKDELIFMEGNYTITADGHGITGKDYVAVKSGIFYITAGKDGIRSTNTKETNLGFVRIEDGTFTINAGNDGIQAETLAYIMDGTLDITTGGGSENGVSHTDMGFPGGGFGNRPEGMPEMQDGEMPTEMSEMKDDAATPKSGDTAESTDTTENTTSKKGMKAGNIIYLQNGNINFNTADDAVHSNGDVTVIDGTYTIASGDDGIHADTILTIDNGTIMITKSYEGLEGSQITINDGIIDVTASDDGVNVAGGNDGSSVNGRPGQNPFAVDTQQDQETENQATETENADKTENVADEQNNDIETILTINGGAIHIDASGDGLDSNGAIVQNGGTVTVDGPENGGNGALDYDTTYTMNGGSLLAAGSSGMMQSISDDSTVYCLSMIYSDNLAAGDEVSITDDSGDILYTYTLSKSGNSIVYADEKLQKDMTVVVSVNGEEQTVTVEEINTQVAEDGTVTTGAVTDMMGGPGGGGQRAEGMEGGQYMRPGKGNRDTSATQDTKQVN